MELSNSEAIVISFSDRVVVYDIYTFVELFQLEVSLMKSDSREDTQVLAM
jgi:hypothetical protein